MTEHIVEIHTSDRQTWKRCRRKFGWSSTLGENLIAVGPERSAFFLGTGVHFALEDYHGYRQWDHPALAFAAYVDAHKEDELPDDIDELTDLGAGMLSYYAEDWLLEHPEEWQTLWVGGRPQVEVEVAVDLTDLVKGAAFDRYGSEGSERLWELVGEARGCDPKDLQLHYITTFDRVVQDIHERIWVMDYKTATAFDELTLQTNPQAGSYDWSARAFYNPVGYHVEGLIWQQFRKAVPVPPRRVYVGTKKEKFSLDLSQPTTHRLYRHAVQDFYGTIPEKYVDILDFLADLQDEDGDQFIRRDRLRRNEAQRRLEQEKIVTEALEMLDPRMPLYPNPTKDCKWDCAFKAPCLALDDGSDFEHMLGLDFASWSGYKDDWRSRVKHPDTSSDVTTPSLT